jgi:hypothetical protein
MSEHAHNDDCRYEEALYTLKLFPIFLTLWARTFIFFPDKNLFLRS